MTTGHNANVREKGFFTPEELAEFLSVSKATIYRLAGRRELPFHRFGGVLRFSRADIQKYLENERIGPVKF